MSKIYKMGIDVGSTTIKVVLINEEEIVIYQNYERHFAHIQETLNETLKDINKKFGDISLKVKITGSGSINLSKALNIPFIQEVVSVATAISKKAPMTDVAIELGGEDAKIIYFKGGLDERMNGVCAGGTGAFIDQMAALLQKKAYELNEVAKEYQQIYPIAARCGVFAKSDIQPLINEGVKESDLAASIFQAVVNQTISGLACGKPIRGKVAFLGGPLYFLTELKNTFIRTLNLKEEDIIKLDDVHLFAALGAAYESDDSNVINLKDLIERLDKGVEIKFEIKRLEPLFNNQDEYEIFSERHMKSRVKQEDIRNYKGNCFLGIDAGSTTTKVAVVGDKGQLLFSYYTNNQGNPIRAVLNALEELRTILPNDAKIVRSCSTGYGESLLKTALSLDEGEVETIAHTTAAAFFNGNVDCVLDIGGQDMKCIKLKDGVVDTILLNEACSSGCGSFIENFANSLGYDAAGFAREALYAKNPVDLGTRCTVFMNSNVKQAQKEGASVSDISAGLAYSVIKNALFKVIKLTDVKELGTNIVVQGGTFYNQAVLRALEKIVGVEVICPDISGIMGAFGAALIARSHYDGTPSRMISLLELDNLSYKTKVTRCNGCLNHCVLTVNKFSNGSSHITGNRCEKGLGNDCKKLNIPNLYEYKKERIFGYEPLKDAPRGKIGIPRVLNMYENYPFWATFFKELGFEVVLSPFSNRKIYELGMESIPSESECYPAKLAHGHVEWLIQNGIKTIFHPCVFYEHKETLDAQNNYNYPIVISYAENLKNNVENITNGTIQYLRPFISFASIDSITNRLIKFCKEIWNITTNEIKKAVKFAWEESRKVKEDIRNKGKEALKWMEENDEKGIVLAGRPYHVDPEINHGIPEMITSYGLAVLSEDSLPIDFIPKRPIRVNDQWVFHSRLYTAAEFICSRDDLEIIQLNSFGCGLDAVTTDQVHEIMEKNNKLYTVLKIDEVNNLGAARIRLRSLLSAMHMRQKNNVEKISKSIEYDRSIFTEQMVKEKYTIIAPQMSPIHFDILEPILKAYNYNFVVLKNDNRNVIDVGLKYVNNDACYPTITVVGQIMDAVLSGEYDVNHLAIMMTQTGGCCRASNYIALIRRALDKVGLSHIPVISLNANKMETNPGFKIYLPMLLKALKGVVYGDLIMKCLYRVRPYELVKGSANELVRECKEKCIDSLVNKKSKYKYNSLCKEIVNKFDTLPIIEDLKKPKVGIVGEILVKYMPLANNNLVDLLESEGAEVVVPDLIDFLNYSLYNQEYKHEFLGTSFLGALVSRVGISTIENIRKPASDALAKSNRFGAPMSIKEKAEHAKPFLSIGNQYGEGWFLTGEMVEMLLTGTPNIVCIQPFACLPNHVVGKGVIKALKKAYPYANISAIDYDPGASEVNQLNRIKLMLTTAKRNV